MKILFIGPTRIGDTILSTSILNFYIKKFDQCSISVVTSSFAKDLYKFMPHLQEIIVVDKKRFGLHWLNIIKFAIFKKWDLVIDLRSSATSYFLNTKKRMIFRGNELSHKVMQFSKFIDTKEALIPEIWYSQEDVDISYKKIKNNDHLIAVAPYSNWPKKDWSLKKYKNLFQNEFFKNHTIILTGVSRDIVNKREIEEFIKTSELEIINLFDWGNLRNMVPIFKKCRFFIGSDSGLMHLAASSGCKTFALFGPTNDLVYGPWGNHKVIKSDKDRDYGLENLSVEKVLNSIKECIR